MPIEPKNHKTSSGQERRLEFIDFRLRWEGKLNRKDLIEHFGVSVPQASLDIAKYLELAPSNLNYDPSSRSYHSTSHFQPVFTHSSASRYLAELLATKTGVLEPSGSFIGIGVEVGYAPTPSRAMDEETIVSLVRAIKGQRSVLARYQSMSSLDSERELSPLALGHDGFRWHVRAYCHQKSRFSDFVLTRLSNIQENGAALATLGEDMEWNTVVTLVLVPHPDLTANKQAAIAYDYGMVGGEALLPCRQALLFYTLKHLGLAGGESPAARQIFLKNHADVQPYLDALHSRS